uniref:Uncharacterized protein n=1 Tax=Fagus sylvatica TaxID=28930 RepID=A0A2N9H7B6_FAGSY
MRGRGSSFIGGVGTPCAASCRAARGLMPRDVWPFGAQNGSCAIPSESLRCLLSNDIRFAQIRVRTEELWLPKVEVSELFFCVFPAKIPAKRGKLLENRELRLAAGVAVFLMHPSSWINSQQAGRNPRAKAVVREERHVRFSARFPYFLSVFARTDDLTPDVGFRHSWYYWKACATLFFKVLDLRETELGLERYGPANRGHWSVFGLPEGNFPIEIPARPEKILTIREFHAVSEYVLFLKVMGSRITFQRFSRAWIAIVLDVGFRRSWCRRKACITFFFKVLALYSGELGFARCSPANRGHWNVSHVGGSFSDRDYGLTGGALDDPRVSRGVGQPNLVFSPVKPRSNLVKPPQTLGNVLRAPSRGSFDAADPCWVNPAQSGLPCFACRHPRKS